MSKINGAGTCAAYAPATELLNAETGQYEMAPSSTLVGLTKEEAQAWANIPGGRWCCDSCSSASWLQ